MALLIDSSVFIEAERQRLNLDAVVALIPSGELLGVASVTVSELLVGVHLGSPEIRQAERQAVVDEIVSRIPILDFDLPAARVYAEIWAGLRRAGNIIAPHDLMIGAIALANGSDVLTQNVRDFSRITGLGVSRPNWPR
jgi:tRNA(fMet)-specific endonuclease VapC